MLDVGSGHMVRKDKIVAITRSAGKPLTRLRQAAEDENKLIDCASGRKVKSLIFLMDGFVVASNLHTETLVERFAKGVKEWDELEKID